MNGRFPLGWVLVVSTLAAYLALATLLAGEAKLPIGALLAVLVLWFSVYKFRYRDLRSRETANRMYSDLNGAIERLAERHRVANEQARERAAAEDERLARMERKRRERIPRPTKDPAVGRYAEMIEQRVREAEAARHGREAPDRTPEEGSDRP